MQKMSNSVRYAKFLSKYLFSGSVQFRRHLATKKRFYRKTGIVNNDGKFEITLDQRKLKTPKGHLFSVESEPLALLVASEWDAQKEKVQPTSMHLNALCCTVIDNPNNLSKFDMVQYIVKFLETDTILFQSGEDDELYKFQKEKWDPVIQWFCDCYQVDLQKTRSINGPVVSEKTKATITKHLLSYNFAAIHGYVYGVDTLKSLILTLACAERFLTPEKATLLTRLEEEFQTGHWGRIEWAHGLNQQDIQARIAATVLFIYFNSSSSLVQSKRIS